MSAGNGAICHGYLANVSNSPTCQRRRSAVHARRDSMQPQTRAGSGLSTRPSSAKHRTAVSGFTPPTGAVAAVQRLCTGSTYKQNVFNACQVQLSWHAQCQRPGLVMYVPASGKASHEHDGRRQSLRTRNRNRNKCWSMCNPTEPLHRNRPMMCPLGCTGCGGRPAKDRGSWR